MSQLGAEVCRFDDVVFLAEGFIDFFGTSFAENCIRRVKTGFRHFLFATSAWLHTLYRLQGVPP